MTKVKPKNEKKLNSCPKCGLLTHNGKNSLCNTCGPFKQPAEEIGTPTVNDLSRRPMAKVIKPKGKQLQKYSQAGGKTVRNIEYSTGSLLIYFTDNSYLHITGDNDGDGGYVSLLISREQEEKNDYFRWNAYACENCRHQWLPRSNSNKPKRCPKCGNPGIISVMDLHDRELEKRRA